MKPSSRVQGVIEVLERTASSRVPMDSTIGDYMRGRRYIGSKDRANIVERVYGIARAQAKLDWYLKEFGELPSRARGLAIAWLALGEKMAAKNVSDLFDGTQYSPAELEEREHEFLNSLAGLGLDNDAMPDWVKLECPPQHEKTLRDLFGKNFENEMRAMMETAPLDLRVNVRLKTRDEAKESLGKDRVATDETPFSPWGLRAREKAYLSDTKAFTKGWVEIQDEGSQLIALICGAQPGMQVLDYCAGAGGKTMALASAMNVKGRIVAMDTEERRLEKARLRFRRAYVSDIIEVRPLADEKNRKWLRRQKETFDVALADVPCSGTGTWRRNPDLRWRHYGPSLAELLPVQAEILEKIAKTVKPGGRLVYATCSLLPEENENQIETFLKAHPEFEVAPIADIWGEGEPPCIGPYLRLSPYGHKTDGFFAAVLIRK